MKLKTCVDCGHKGPPEDFIYGNQERIYCTKCCKKRAHEHHMVNKERLNAYAVEYNKVNKERINEQRRGSKRSDWQKKYCSKIRIKILEHYGGTPPKCACCGENHIEFLCIDHINGEGKIKGLAGNSFYFWVVKNNYPSYLRVLCHNCNMALGFYGYCPHHNLEELIDS